MHYLQSSYANFTILFVLFLEIVNIREIYLTTPFIRAKIQQFFQSVTYINFFIFMLLKKQDKIEVVLLIECE